MINYHRELQREETSNSKQINFFPKQSCYASSPVNHGLLLRFQAKAVRDAHITECTSNARIKICSDKILSWDCHAGTDAKIIAQKLCWSGSLSGMEDIDYWSCNNYIVPWRCECFLGERQVYSWKTLRCSSLQSKTDIRSCELLTENRVCNSSWGFVWGTMLGIKSWAEMKAINCVNRKKS